MSSDAFSGMVFAILFGLLTLLSGGVGLVATFITIRKDNGTACGIAVMAGMATMVFLIVASLNLDRWLCGVTVPW